MTSITPSRNVLVIGVDTHKDSHTACAVDGFGNRVGEIVVPASRAGYEWLHNWASQQGKVVLFGVEGTGSYGAGLTRYLRHQGEDVREVNRPGRGDRRRCGKDDLLDAEHAAREALAGRATVIPKAGDGTIEAIRVVKVARDTAVKARSQTMVALKAVLVTADDELRTYLEPLSDLRLVKACADLSTAAPTAPSEATRYSLAMMARRWLQLQGEIKEHDRHLERLTAHAAPRLTNATGIGAVTAAQLLTAFGDNRDRIHSEAAFAKICGVCPIPASSGKTERHRLNRGGNRQANAALHRIVVNRLRWHKPTQAYVARRKTEGLSKRDAIRCLKRFVAREAYRLVTEAGAPLNLGV